MEDNPFFGLLTAMQSDPAATPVVQGQVTGTSQLRIRVRGNDISGANLLISLEFKEAMQNGKVSPGDRVLLLTEDDQLYYLICKVVNG